MLLYTLSAFDTLPERWSLIWLMSASIVILMTSNLQKENSSEPVSFLEVKSLMSPSMREQLVLDGSYRVQPLRPGWYCLLVTSRKCKRKKSLKYVGRFILCSSGLFFNPSRSQKLRNMEIWGSSGLLPVTPKYPILLSSVIQIHRSLNLKTDSTCIS